MHIEDLKRWHWIAISLVVGLGLAYAYSGVASEGSGGNRRTIGPGEFLRQLGRTTTDASGNRLPLVRNVRVYPEVERKHLVTLEELVITTERDGMRTGEYQPRQLVAEIPFALTRQRPPSDNWTVLDELGRRATANADIRYRYIAAAAPKYVYAISMTASFLLLGVIWPTIIRRLSNAGYGAPARSPKDDRYDLSKARSGSGKSTPAPMRKGPTQADLDQLDAVTAQYQQNVAGMTAPSPAAGSTGSAAASPQRTWDAAPLEQATAPVKQEEDDIEVKGEYYPVLIHHKKPTDEQKQ